MLYRSKSDGLQEYTVELNDLREKEERKIKGKATLNPSTHSSIQILSEASPIMGCA